MSAAGDSLGAALLARRKAAMLAFAASLGYRRATAVDTTRLALLLAKAEGNAINDAMPHIFIGTDPNPNPAGFQDGDIYLLREE
jgi:hypothetical protein